MTIRRTALVTVAAIVIGAGAFFARAPLSQEAQPPSLIVSERMSISGIELRIAVADTPTEREQGLSGYAPLGADEGLLFVFPADGRHSFWMKDMLFPIDMLWLDAEGRVVHIEKDVSPDTFPTAFTPDSPARYVLEVPAGFCDMHDIVVGEEAILP